MAVLDKAVVGVFVLPIILLIVSMFGPWYNYTAEGGSGYFSMKISEDFYFDKCSINADVGSGVNFLWGAGTIDLTIHYSDESFEGFNNIIETMETTRNLVVVGIIFSIVGLIGMILFVKNDSFKLGLLFGILALVFTLLPSLYIMNVLPGAMADDGFIVVEDQENDFFGSTEFIGVKQTWGGGWGWWAALTAGLLCILGFVIFIIDMISTYPRGNLNGRARPKVKRRWF